MKRLAAVLDQLSPVQQRVLLLRYYGQMGFAEIAELIDCPLEHDVESLPPRAGDVAKAAGGENHEPMKRRSASGRTTSFGRSDCGRRHAGDGTRRPRRVAARGVAGLRTIVGVGSITREPAMVNRRIALRRWPLLAAVATAVCVLICLDVASRCESIWTSRARLACRRQSLRPTRHRPRLSSSRRRLRLPANWPGTIRSTSRSPRSASRWPTSSQTFRMPRAVLRHAPIRPATVPERNGRRQALNPIAHSLKETRPCRTGKFAVVLLAGTAILLLLRADRVLRSGARKSAPGRPAINWPGMTGHRARPHDGDRPPPPNRDRRNACSRGRSSAAAGPPRHGDSDRPPPPDRDRPQPASRGRSSAAGTAAETATASSAAPTRWPRSSTRASRGYRRQGRRGRRAMVTAIGNRRATAKGAWSRSYPRRDHPGGQRGLDWQSLERADPEMYKLLKADQELDHQTRELAMQWRPASTEQAPISRRRSSNSSASSSRCGSSAATLE